MEYEQDNKFLWAICGFAVIIITTITLVQTALYPPTKDSSYIVKEYATNTIVCKEENIPLLRSDKLTIEVTFTDDNAATHIREFRDNSFSIADSSYVEETEILYLDHKTYKLYLSEEDYKKIRKID